MLLPSPWHGGAADDATPNALRFRTESPNSQSSPLPGKAFFSMSSATAIRGRIRRLTLATGIVAAVGAGLLAPTATALAAEPGTPTAGVTAAADTRGIVATHDPSLAFELIDTDGVPMGNQNVRVCTGTKSIGPFTDVTMAVLLPTGSGGSGTLPAGDGGGVGAGDGCTEADGRGEHRHDRRHGGAGRAHRG